MSGQKDYVVEVHWSEVLYNPYRKGLFPELLRTGKHSLISYERIKGMKKTDDEIKVRINFDEDYLVSYFIKKVFAPLHIGSETEDFNNLLKVLSKANKQFKKELQGSK